MGVKYAGNRRPASGGLDRPRRSGQPWHVDGNRPPTADLVADARRRKIEAARATIFRTLEILTGLGVVERLDLPNGDHSYVRCDSRAHHHHLVCTRCQRSIDLEDLGMTPILAQVARRTGYKIDRHRVELFGLCPTCQQMASSAG